MKPRHRPLEFTQPSLHILDECGSFYPKHRIDNWCGARPNIDQHHICASPHYTTLIVFLSFFLAESERTADRTNLRPSPSQFE